jgi:GntR family transcriptional regulator
MPTAKRRPIAAYQKIQQTILRQIEKGELKPGDAVTSERELARIHGVSLMTARHGLSILEREGVVLRRPGAGTFVSAPKIHFNKLASFTEEMSTRGLTVRSKVLSFVVGNSEHEVAARLGLRAGDRVLRFERLRLGGDEPFALETCYLSASQFSGLRSDMLERGSLFSILKYNHDVELTYSDEEIDATTPTASTARLLKLAKGVSLLRIRQVIYSSKGQPALYVLGFYRSDRYKLTIRRYR